MNDNKSVAHSLPQAPGDGCILWRKTVAPEQRIRRPASHLTQIKIIAHADSSLKPEHKRIIDQFDKQVDVDECG